ncbi:MAG TPA: hypothetical protein VGC53_14660, partial [Vicinamibacteria bacterium]
ERGTARQLWKILYDTAENDQMRYNALLHLQQLDALDQTDLLSKVALQFKQDRGHFPGGWEEMIAGGYLRGVPADPVGVPYVLNPKAERAEVSQNSSLSAVPTR